MTNYTGNPSNAQSRINLLTPGDTLTLESGTYPSLNIAVSGTANNPITIRGGKLDELKSNYASTIINSTLNITGSYLNLGYFFVTAGAGTGTTGGVRINGSQHVSLEMLWVKDVSGPSVWIYNNARYIYLHNAHTGRYSGTDPQERTSCGFEVGSAPGATVTDRTGYVYLGITFCTSTVGDQVKLHPGTHHIKMYGSATYHDNIPSGPGDPPKTYSGYVSYATNAQFICCSFFSEPLNGFRILETTINGERFGENQHLLIPRMREAGYFNDPQAGAIASNSPTIKVWYPLVVGEPLHSVELDGVHWYNDEQVLGFERLNEFEEKKWASPAQHWSVSYIKPNDVSTPVTGKNEYGLFKHWYSNMGLDGQNIYLSNDPDEGYFPRKPYPVGQGTEFFHNEEEHSIAVRKIGYYQGWHNIYATQAAIFDLHTQEQIGPLITLNPPVTNYQGWVHTELPWDPPILLEPYRHYRVVVYTPANSVPVWYVYYSPDYLGGFPLNFWRTTNIGYPGITDGIIRVPPDREAHVTRVFGRLRRYYNLGLGWHTDQNTQVYSYVPPGEIPDLHVQPGPPYRPGYNSDDEPTYGDYEHPLVMQSFEPFFPLVQGVGVLVDCVVGHWREPQATTVDPSTGLQKALDDLIPGDVLTISGTHLIYEMLRAKVSGSPDRPITIKGDGTAIIRGGFGTDTVFDLIRVTGNFLKIENIVFEMGGRGLVLEECQNSKIKNVTCRHIYGTGFSCQDGSDFVYFDGCTAHDTGSDLNTGNGFRVGTMPNRWPRDPEPEPTKRIRFDNCTAYRVKGNGFDANAGASQVVFKNCTVDHGQGNAPDWRIPAGTSGFYSRGDTIQFVNCTVLAAPTAGFRPWDVLWDGKVYGRGQWVSAGQSTGHGEGGVVSQSDDLKVTPSFTATPDPRLKEIDGGWSASAGTGTFKELTWTSQAASL